MAAFLVSLAVAFILTTFASRDTETESLDLDTELDGHNHGHDHHNQQHHQAAHHEAVENSEIEKACEVDSKASAEDVLKHVKECFNARQALLKKTHISLEEQKKMGKLYNGKLKKILDVLNNLKGKGLHASWEKDHNNILRQFLGETDTIEQEADAESADDETSDGNTSTNSTASATSDESSTSGGEQATESSTSGGEQATGKSGGEQATESSTSGGEQATDENHDAHKSSRVRDAVKKIETAGQDSTSAAKHAGSDKDHDGSNSDDAYTLRSPRSKGMASDCPNVHCSTKADAGSAGLAECKADCDKHDSCNLINFDVDGAHGVKGRCCLRACQSLDDHHLNLVEKWGGWDVYTKKSAANTGGSGLLEKEQIKSGLVSQLINAFSWQ